jgi:molybdopterin-guanine dinucleotide biosynthesis protein A
MRAAGAIIAGGRSTRYGSPKALAAVGGERIIDRVVRAVRVVTPRLLLVASAPELVAAAALDARPDALPGAGPLGGIYTALLWAVEQEYSGVLAVACDMPFLSSPLLAHLLARAEAGGADVVAPESGGRREIEPLCAFYATTCVEALRSALDRGDNRMIAFHEDVRVERIPLAEVRAWGDPETLFLNVNTPEDRILAERLAASGA